MFWDTPKDPKEWSWGQLEYWLLMTEDTFNANYSYRHKQFEYALETNTAGVRPKKGSRTPEERISEITQLREIRRKLIDSGWLPPRKRDMLGQPDETNTQWSLNRKYDIYELATGNYADNPERT